jgi:hypothetical protein
MADERVAKRLYAVPSQELPARDSLHSPNELGPLPSWPDLLAVFGVCIPLWAGLTWLIYWWL